MYCLTCEKEIGNYTIDEIQFHLDVKVMNGEIDLIGCTGPFFTSPPPDKMTEEMWEVVFANEPSDEELKQMEHEYKL